MAQITLVIHQLTYLFVFLTSIKTIKIGKDSWGEGLRADLQGKYVDIYLSELGEKFGIKFLSLKYEHGICLVYSEPTPWIKNGCCRHRLRRIFGDGGSATHSWVDLTGLKLLPKAILCFSLSQCLCSLLSMYLVPLHSSLH